MILCITGSTRVSTERGSIPIDELWESSEPIADTCDLQLEHDGKWAQPRILDLKVQSDDGLKESPIVLKKSPAPINRILTDRGFTFSGADKHLVRVLDLEDPVNPQYSWKNLKDVSVGDYIALSSEEAPSPKDYVRINW